MWKLEAVLCFQIGFPHSEISENDLMDSFLEMWVEHTEWGDVHLISPWEIFLTWRHNNNNPTAHISSCSVRNLRCLTERSPAEVQRGGDGSHPCLLPPVWQKPNLRINALRWRWRSVAAQLGFEARYFVCKWGTCGEFWERHSRREASNRHSWKNETGMEQIVFGGRYSCAAGDVE